VKNFSLAQVLDGLEGARVDVEAAERRDGVGRETKEGGSKEEGRWRVRKRKGARRRENVARK
jgi:hypothetical protein